MLILDFVECGMCSVLPGTPTLCKSCIHNRDAILELLRQVREFEKKIPKAIHAVQDHGRYTLCNLPMDMLKDPTSSCLDDITCRECSEKLLLLTHDSDDEEEDDEDKDYEDWTIGHLRRECAQRSIRQTCDGSNVNHSKKGKLIIVLEDWDERRHVLLNLSLEDRITQLEETVKELNYGKEN